MAKRSNQIPWLNGVRGFTCMMVFIAHFMCCFCPQLAEQYPPTPHSVLGTILAYPPLNLFFGNGNGFMNTFCTTTGIVAALAIFNRRELLEADQKRLSDSLVNRYMRLIFPIFVINVIVFIMLRLDLFTTKAFSMRVASDWAGTQYYQYDPNSTVFTLLFDSFVRIPIKGSTMYCYAFWMIPYVFFGYFASMILAQMSWGKSDRILLVWLFLSFCLLLSGEDLAACFPLGTAFAYLIKFKHFEGKKMTVLGFVLLIVGCFLVDYPTHGEAVGIYAFLNREILKVRPYMFWHFIGASLVMSGIVICRPLQRFFSRSGNQFIGKINYGLFLLHIPVIATVGTGSALWMMDHTALDYSWIALIVFVLCTLVLLPLSWLFGRCIEEPCGKLAVKINEFLKVREST